MSELLQKPPKMKRYVMYTNHSTPEGWPFVKICSRTNNKQEAIKWKKFWSVKISCYIFDTIDHRPLLII
jgi:hypothetical protein